MSASSTSVIAVEAESGGSWTPQVQALFLIRFDKTIGYTIAWKRSKSEIHLEDAVEYKSLPSGLHAVQSDLVYFTHEGYIGLAAFAQSHGSAEERNATFVSIGLLVHNEGRAGRLGRVWLLAARLQQLAATMAADWETVAPLEAFWEENKTQHVSPGLGEESRPRAVSTSSTVVDTNEMLAEDHPARSMTQYLDTLGPLVFQLQQAALLRKRILFVGSAPVRTACEFVYNLSVLSSISPRCTEYFASDTEHLLRLPSLFSIGVHDIPTLEHLHGHQERGQASDDESLEGWAACTTDDIIATKRQLYDIVVELPPSHDASPQERRWPRIRTSDGYLIRASQREAARYMLLRRELYKARHLPHTRADASSDVDSVDEERVPLLSREEADTQGADDSSNEIYDDSMVEPMTWARFAYQGFMWWASAGEKDAETRAERDADRELIGDLSRSSQSVETGIIAYFHRQTALLFSSLSERIQEHGDNDGEGEGGEDDASDGNSNVLWIDRDDLSRMGLDTWSEADRAFVQEFGNLYFGRCVEVKSNRSHCCGII